MGSKFKYYSTIPYHPPCMKEHLLVLLSWKDWFYL